MSGGIKNTFARLHKRVTPKRILVTVIAVIAVLLPTVLAIVSLKYSERTDDELSTRAETVIVFDADGCELFREEADARENGDTSLVSIFNTINANMTATDKISDSVVTEAPLTVQLISSADTKTLVCYFSFTEGASYCIDESGAYYKIPAEDSERFLASIFAESLYSESTIPTLTTADGDVIIPMGVSWHYRNIENNYLQASLNEITGDLCTYHVTGGISLMFSETPDLCSVEIYDGAERVFVGQLEELSNLTLDSDTSFSVTVSAEWIRTEGRRYFGAVNYSFDISVHNRAVFNLNKNKLSAGEYAILEATNISDISRLSFTSDIPDFEPTFMSSGEKAYTIIPCPSEVSVDGSYKLTVSYGVSSQTFTIFAEENEVLKQYRLNRATESAGIFTILNDTADSGHIFLGGATLVPSDVYSVERCFGDTLYDGEYSYLTEYSRTDGYGMTVLAVSGGRVVYVDSNQSDVTYVVVNIGLGMNVLYAHLSSADVSVGDYLAAGDVIGRTGTLADGVSEGFALSLICGNTVLDSKHLFE